MDEILPPTRSQDSREPKRRRQKSNQSKAESQLTAVMAKLVLKNSLEIRELQACTLCVFLIPKDSDLSKAVKGAYDEFGPRFASATKEERPNLISPAVAAWIGVVRTILATPALLEPIKKGLTTHTMETNTKQLASGVQLVKTRKAWDKATLKLLICVNPRLETQMAMVSSGIETCGGKIKRGVAPRGGLESGVQDLLDTLEAF